MNKPESRTERLERTLKAADDKPQSAAAHYNVGLAYQKMGPFQSAEKAYLRALEIDPTIA